jgi:S1-C subfamily serine protease
VELIVQTGQLAGGRLPLDPGQTLTIGRHDSSDLRLDDPSVSRFHARLRVDNDATVWIEDNGSANGTFVDGRRIVGPERLVGGERIQIGQASMTVEALAARPVAPGPVEFGAVGAGGEIPRAPGPATIERRILRDAVERANRVALAGVVIGVVAVVVVGWLLLSSRPDGTVDTAALVTDLRPSVVQVSVDYGEGFLGGGGSGWVLDVGDGLIVTNHHVIDGAQGIIIAGEGMVERDAEIVATAPCEDLAMLQVDRRDGLKTLPLGSQGDLRQGETVVVLGYPGTAGPGTDLVVTTGVVSVVRTAFAEGIDTPAWPNVIQTDAAINPGNSGGPLVTANGRLVGVNSAVLTDLFGRTIQGQGYAIGVDRVKEIIPRLQDGESLAWTGMAFEYPVFFNDLSALGLPDRDGLVVRIVTPGTPAEAAGFGVDPALVVAVDGVDMDGTLAGYCAAAGARRSGDSAVFTVVTAGDTASQDVSVAFR